MPSRIAIHFPSVFQGRSETAGGSHDARSSGSRSPTRAARVRTTSEHNRVAHERRRGDYELIDLTLRELQARQATAGAPGPPNDGWTSGDDENDGGRPQWRRDKNLALEKDVRERKVLEEIVGEVIKDLVAHRVMVCPMLQIRLHRETVRICHTRAVGNMPGKCSASRRRGASVTRDLRTSTSSGLTPGLPPCAFVVFVSSWRN